MSDAIKAGQRHRFADQEVMSGLRREMKAYVLKQMSGADDIAAKMTDAFKALGFEDEDGDGEITPDEAAAQAEEGEEPETKGVPAIAADAHPGAMICLIVPDEVQEMLRALGGDKDAEPDHITLCYLASDASTIEDQKNTLLHNLSILAESGPAVEGVLGGFARFNASEGSDGMDVLVALVDSPDLPPLHAAICDAVHDAGIESPSEHGFIPHITLAYVEPGSKGRVLDVPREPVVFDRLSLVWGGQRIDFPFAADDGEYDADHDHAQTTPALMGAVKMLDDGTLVAQAVRFGSADEPDMSAYADYFDANTNFWLKQWDRRPMLYHHAMDEGTKDAPVIGTWIKAWADDAGVWLQGQLDVAHKYHAAIKELARRGLLKVSTDSAPHLVQRARQPNGTHYVKTWPILAASLTPSPAEPRLLPAELKAALADLGLLIDAGPEATLEGDTQRRESAVVASDAAQRLALELELLDLENDHP
jgi:2'-5' RNA ligase